MKKLTRNLYLIIISLFVINSIANASFQLVLDKLPQYSTEINIDTTKFPLFQVRIKAIKDGNQVALALNNIAIVENNRVVQPKTISGITNGWQTLSWYYKIEGGTRIVACYQNEVAQVTPYTAMSNFPYLKIFTDKAGEETDINFGYVQPGKTSSYNLILNCVVGTKDTVGNEQLIRIDSIRTGTTSFASKWIGGMRSYDPPPVSIIPGFNYRSKVTYQPQNTNYIRDKFYVHYLGGLVSSINLTGNKFEVPQNSYLKLLKPNGGEKMTPCEKYEIKWVGNNPGISTIIEFTTDGGNDWIGIGTSTDTSFIWTIPNVSSEYCKVRVRQDITTTKAQKLVVDDIPSYKIAHSPDGYKLLDANLAGMIREWNLVDFTASEPYAVPGISYPYNKVIPIGVGYIAGNTKFFMSYKNFQNNDEFIAFFDKGNTSPTNTIQLPSDFLVKKVLIDPKQQYLACIPSFASQIQIYSAIDGSFIKSVSLPNQITAFCFNPTLNQAAVALVTGEVKILNVPDFSEIQSIDFSDLPIIGEIGFAPNGQYLALGCIPAQPTMFIGNKNEIHVVDIPTKQIIRTYNKTASTPLNLSFSPVSTLLLVGAAGQPQLALWDLPSDSFDGNFSGNSGMLTDVSFSPVGYSIASSSNSWDHLWVQSFTHPELAVSADFFSIIAPQLTSDSIQLQPLLVSTDNSFEMQRSICNTGIVPIVFNDQWLSHGINFSLTEKIMPDTLFPGDCKEVKFTCNPKDTGRLSDSVVFSSCIGYFYIPIVVNGLNRNLTFKNPPFTFGDACIGDSIELDFEFIRNNDSVPVKINRIDIENNYNNFRIVSKVQDTILMPGQWLTVRIRFIPNQIGENIKTADVIHSDIPHLAPKAVLKGTGIETNYNISHHDLRFIPEIKDRYIIINNLSNNSISLDSSSLNQSSEFKILTSFPIRIPALGKDSLLIRWTGTDSQDISFSLFASPCPNTQYITLGKFSGISTISIPQVDADPKGEAVIPINFSNQDRQPYNGVRPFEMEFTINPRMFLPTSVKSIYGTATLTTNSIINDRRIVGIKVNGDFANIGTLAEVKGIAGLAEIDTSVIAVSNNAKFWGVSVQTSTVNGLFKLINLCGTRRIIQNTGVTILSVNPNPANDKMLLDFDCSTNNSSNIKVFNSLGVVVLELLNIETQPGTNSVEINCSSLAPGSYRIAVYQGGNFDSREIIVLN